MDADTLCSFDMDGGHAFCSFAPGVSHLKITTTSVASWHHYHSSEHVRPESDSRVRTNENEERVDE